MEVSRQNSLVSKVKLQLILNSSPWVWISAVLLLLIAIPIIFIVLNSFTGSNETILHIIDTLMLEYLTNSIILTVCVSLFIFIMGVIPAWLITIYDFPLRKALSQALILPLAIPAYINAYAYKGIFDISGLYSRLSVFLFGVDTSLSFDIMTMEGAIFVFTISLYPYVYIISRSSFQNQCASLLEVSRLYGKSQSHVFFRIAVPLIRPAVFGGMLLAVMEILNDYGVVKYYGIPTFTTGIFKAWSDYGADVTAMKLSLFLIAFVIIIHLIEYLQRGRVNLHTSSSFKPIQRKKHGMVISMLLLFVCSIPFILGFALPVIQLIIWALTSSVEYIKQDYLNLTLNSFLLAFLTAVFASIVALIISYTKRVRPNNLIKRFNFLTSLGYSIPGAVIAIGIMILMAKIDKNIFAYLAGLFDKEVGLVLFGSFFALSFAYVIRYLAVSYNSINSGFEKISSRSIESSLSLGANPLRTFFRVALPLNQQAIIAAIILVFIDILKELPLTLILSPTNFSTLATRTYQLADDEMLQEAGVPALIIVGIGVAIIYLLDKLINYYKVREKGNGRK